MKLLVLDLATHLGFAFGDVAGVREHGSHRLPSTGDDIGAFLHAYRSWFSEMLARLAPVEMVGFEMPNLPDTTHLHTLRKLYSLCGITELICSDRHIPCVEANLLDIRRHFIGTAKAPKDVRCTPECKKAKCGRCRTARRAWIKETTVSMCRARGFRPQDDNDADAIALFSLVMSKNVPGFDLIGTEIARAA